MHDAIAAMVEHRARAQDVDRRGWTDRQWIADADRLMGDLNGSVLSLVNGHVLALLAEVDVAGTLAHERKIERDALAATVARVEALVIGDFDPERSDVTVAAIRAAIHPKGDHRG